jgi:hypothetical protein
MLSIYLYPQSVYQPLLDFPEISRFLIHTDLLHLDTEHFHQAFEG